MLEFEDRTGLARRVTFEGALFAADDEREDAADWVAGSMVLVTFEGVLFAADEREDAVVWVAGSMVLAT